MRKAISAISFGVVFAASVAHAGVPDWVRQAADQKISTQDPEIKAIVLLDETRYTVQSNDDLIEHRRRVVKIVRNEGREEGHLAAWAGNKGKFSSIHAWTIDKAGRDYELKDKDFQESSPYSEDLYSDIRLRVAQAPAADPGSVVAFEYEVRRKPWLRELQWFFQEDNPVLEARLIVEMPPGWEHKEFWAGTSPFKPVQAGQGWQWTVNDVPAIKPEPRMPAFESLSKHMNLSYFGPERGAVSLGSWSALGIWYYDLTRDRRNPTPEISHKARELTDSQPEFEGKVKALTTFVQSDIRYLSIRIGIGGYQPHPAADVFRARYGDCKDKATLLSSLLREAGIASDYVLIDTERGTVHPDVPSARFNHAILGIELPPATKDDVYHSVVRTQSGKRYLIFDPTDEYTPVGDLRADLQDSYALLVTDRGGELIHTPLQAPETNSLLREGHFILNADGSLTGEVTEKRTGDHALFERHALGGTDQQHRVERIEKQLGISLQGFTLQSTDIGHLTERDKELVLNYKFTVPSYAQRSGPLTLIRPRVLGETVFAVDQKPRNYPLELHGTSRERDVYEIELPAGYKVDDVPEPVKLDMDFATYQSKTEVNGTRLRYWREYVVRKLDVTPDRLQDLRRFEGLIGGDELAAAVLVKAPSN
jgi:transglutaminase-like putative cysteine protease